MESKKRKKEEIEKEIGLREEMLVSMVMREHVLVYMMTSRMHISSSPASSSARMQIVRLPPHGTWCSHMSRSGASPQDDFMVGKLVGILIILVTSN